MKNATYNLYIRFSHASLKQVLELVHQVLPETKQWFNTTSYLNLKIFAWDATWYVADNNLKMTFDGQKIYLYRLSDGVEIRVSAPDRLSDKYSLELLRQIYIGPESDANELGISDYDGIVDYVEMLQDNGCEARFNFAHHSGR